MNLAINLYLLYICYSNLLIKRNLGRERLGSTNYITIESQIIEKIKEKEILEIEKEKLYDKQEEMLVKYHDLNRKLKSNIKASLHMEVTYLEIQKEELDNNMYKLNKDVIEIIEKIKKIELSIMTLEQEQEEITKKKQIDSFITSMTILEDYYSTIFIKINIAKDNYLMKKHNY